MGAGGVEAVTPFAAQIIPLRAHIEALAAIHPGAGMFVRATLVEAAEARERMERRGARLVDSPASQSSVRIAHAPGWARIGGTGPSVTSSTTTVHLTPYVVGDAWHMTGEAVRACRALGIPWLDFREQRSHRRSYRRELRRMGVSSRDIRIAVRAGRARLVQITIDLGTIGIGSGNVYVSRTGMPNGAALVAESATMAAATFDDFMRSAP